MNKDYLFKGTPGVWETEKIRDTLFVGLMKSSGISMEHIVCSFEQGSELKMEANIENKANAHLIAAAPELLEFAIMMLQSVDGGGKVVTVQDHHLEELRSAVHKALNIND